MQATQTRALSSQTALLLLVGCWLLVVVLLCCVVLLLCCCFCVVVVVVVVFVSALCVCKSTSHAHAAESKPNYYPLMQSLGTWASATSNYPTPTLSSKEDPSPL